jgi:hypothetical protein
LTFDLVLRSIIGPSLTENSCVGTGVRTDVGTSAGATGGAALGVVVGTATGARDGATIGAVLGKTVAWSDEVLEGELDGIYWSSVCL